jgi:hypothetical protein
MLRGNDTNGLFISDLEEGRGGCLIKTGRPASSVQATSRQSPDMPAHANRQIFRYLSTTSTSDRLSLEGRIRNRKVVGFVRWVGEDTGPHHLAHAVRMVEGGRGRGVDFGKTVK